MKLLLLCLASSLYAGTPKYLPDFTADMYVNIQKMTSLEFTPGKLENCKELNPNAIYYEDYLCKTKDSKIRWYDMNGKLLTVNFENVQITKTISDNTVNFEFGGKIDATLKEYKNMPPYNFKLVSRAATPKLLMGSLSSFGISASVKAEISGLSN